MTTIHDFSNADRGNDSRDDVSLEKFLFARASRRAAEAARLAEVRRSFAERMERARAEHVERAERLFSNPGLSRLEREALLQHHRRSMRLDVDAIRHERDTTVGRDQSSSRLGRWVNQRSTTLGDRQDFVHVLKTAYEDRGDEFDPVLLAIPRSRRRREGAMAVYSVRDGRIEREIFRVLPDTHEVVMRSTDERALEAAIVKAHHDFGPPLRFKSTNPAFVKRCVGIAERFGFPVAEESAEASRPAPGQAPTGPTSEPRRESGGDSPVPRSPEVTLGSHEAFKASLTEAYGHDYFMTLSPDAKLAVSGRFLGAEDHPDNPNYYVAAIETAVGITLVAVEKVRLESIEPEAVITLRGIDGKWDVEAPQQSVDPANPAPGTNIDQEHGRGR